jgi:hypothetical protein
MLAALDKAAAMQDAYEVSDAELQLTKKEAVMLHAEPDDTKDPNGVKYRLGAAVAQFCNVKIYRQGAPRSHARRYVGMPSDVELAVWLHSSLADFVAAELFEHLIECLAPKKERRIIVRSFVDGCTERISDRLMELVRRSERARKSNGRELVIVKDAKIKEYMDEHGIHLRKCYAGGGSNLNRQSHAAGRTAGDRANFGRPMSGAAAMLRISK